VLLLWVSLLPQAACELVFDLCSVAWGIRLPGSYCLPNMKLPGRRIFLATFTNTNVWSSQFLKLIFSNLACLFYILYERFVRLVSHLISCTCKPVLQVV
jgi:hypothetical protein